MDNNYYTDDFETLLKEKSDGFRMYPEKRVWHSIYNNFHPSKRWPSTVVCLLLAVGLFFVGHLNKNEISNTNLANKSNALLKPKPINGLVVNVVKPLPKNSASVSKINIKPQNNVVVNNNNANNNTPNNYLTVTNTFTKQPNYTVNNSWLNNWFSQNINGNTKDENTNASFTFNQFNNSNSSTKLETTTSSNTSAEVASENSIDLTNQNTAFSNTKNTQKTTPTDAENKIFSAEQKAWIDDDVFYNKQSSKKWKGRLAGQFYATTGITYRSLVSDSKFASPSNLFVVGNPQNTADVLTKLVNQVPGLSFEIGAGMEYSFAKKLRIKLGLQFNYSSYGIFADATGHTILTSLMLKDAKTGDPYMASRTSTLSNSIGSQTVKLNSKTYQISLPIGVAYKVKGKDKLQWYVGASVEPTYITGGSAYLISADRRNYVKDATMINKFNVNTALETYLSYPLKNGVRIQVGPHFRYQLFSTYSKLYSVDEKLYNLGVKVGLSKSF
jgi:hypothetical protein